MQPKSTFAALAAVASVPLAAAQGAGNYLVTNFISYHAPLSNYTLVSFDLPQSNLTCFGSQLSPDASSSSQSIGLAQFSNTPCNTTSEYWEFTLTQDATTSLWTLNVLSVDYGGYYTFPADAQSQYYFSGALAGDDGTYYDQLTNPGGAFTTTEDGVA